MDEEYEQVSSLFRSPTFLLVSYDVPRLSRCTRGHAGCDGDTYTDAARNRTAKRNQHMT